MPQTCPAQSTLIGPRLLGLPALIALGFLVSGQAADAGVDFVRDVQPILQSRCQTCHGAEKQKGGLRLDVKAAAMKGGDAFAPVIVPGKSAESPLLQAVDGSLDDLRMPPKGKPLTAGEVATLRIWIDQGAHWPEGVDAVKLEDKSRHWAFQPVKRPAVPTVANTAWLRSPIDAFILARLESAHLAPSPDADRLAWLRRVSFNLVGLPPTPEEVVAFLHDPGESAYARVVDRLLASPHYGERWARHWLDVIAFGETHGFEVNTPRPNAWPFRDYVIRALNTDIPYPRFVRDQLAGDGFGEDAATGFLVASAALLPGQIGKDPESMLLARQDQLNSMVLGVGSAFLGLTINCARCHDHKFDPIPQRDYYRLQAVFSGVQFGDRPLPDHSASIDESVTAIRSRLLDVEARLAPFEPVATNPEPTSSAEVPLRPSINASRNVDRFSPIAARRLRFTILQANHLQPCIDEIEVFSPANPAQNLALAANGTRVKASSTYPASSLHRLEHLNDGHYGNGRSWISNEAGKGWVELEFPRTVTIDRLIWARDRTGRYTDRLPIDYRVEVASEAGTWTRVASSEDRRSWDSKQAGKPGDEDRPAEVRALLAERRTLLGQIPERLPPPLVYAGRFTAPEPVFRLNRGDPTQPCEPLGPGFLSLVGPGAEVPADAAERSRRLALAAWIADPGNPLPARVIVNRLWHYHFGQGIVDTPSDFGNNGVPPTHPELLDWLADELVRGGWSLKSIHRQICLSSTYRQSSRPTSSGMAADARTRLFWRFPPRRMEAELIRDAMLSACGTLDSRMEGPGFSVFAPNENYVRVYDPRTEYGPTEWRRMIYQTKVRMAQDSTFGAFDCPDAGLPQPRRPSSTTPLQALNLLNSEFVNQQAESFARRIEHEAGPNPAHQVQRAFLLALGRTPDALESETCARLVHDEGTVSLCRVVLNLNEFLFIP